MRFPKSQLGTPADLPLLMSLRAAGTCCYGHSHAPIGRGCAGGGVYEPPTRSKKGALKEYRVDMHNKEGWRGGALLGECFDHWQHCLSPLLRPLLLPPPSALLASPKGCQRTARRCLAGTCCFSTPQVAAAQLSSQLRGEGNVFQNHFNHKLVISIS